MSEWILDACNTITSVNQQQSLLQTQITMQQNKMITDAAEATWDAYMRGYNIQQEAQYQEAKMMLYRFSIPELREESLLLIASEIGFIGACASGSISGMIATGIPLYFQIKHFIMEERVS